jgi:pilus assembly protein Flp/PilA
MISNAILQLVVRATTLRRYYVGRDRGATAVEYGLLVALIAIVIIGGVTLLGTNLSTLFNNVATSVQNRNGGAPAN